jgi:hypothetical protein
LKGDLNVVKIIFTVKGAKLLHVHSVSQLSQQLLTPFESCFNFPDRPNTHKLMLRPILAENVLQRESTTEISEEAHLFLRFVTPQKGNPKEGFLFMTPKVGLHYLLQNQKHKCCTIKATATFWNVLYWAKLKLEYIHKNDDDRRVFLKDPL